MRCGRLRGWSGEFRAKARRAGIRGSRPLRQAQGRLFAKNAKERGTLCIGDASESKSLGHAAGGSFAAADFCGTRPFATCAKERGTH
jgi:hypothetical protein